MEESELLIFKKAPYLELDDYKAPKGIESYFVTMDDGIKLRVCHWKVNLGMVVCAIPPVGLG